MARLEYQRKWNADNAERVAQYKRDWHERNPTYSSDIARRRRVERPYVTLVEQAKRRARKRGLRFDLTAEWAVKRWTGCCELTGEKFVVGVGNGGQGPFSPSIDRINPRRGYVQSNCRFILHGLNALKGGGSDADMRAVARALVRSEQ